MPAPTPTVSHRRPSYVAWMCPYAHIDAGRKHAYRAVNTAMVYSYYELGRRIVEEEQGGAARAGYGKQVIVRLSEMLTQRYKRSFSVTNLKQMRSFFLLYSQDEIGQTVSDQSAGLSLELVPLPQAYAHRERGRAALVRELLRPPRAPGERESHHRYPVPRAAARGRSGTCPQGICATSRCTISQVLKKTPKEA